MGVKFLYTLKTKVHDGGNAFATSHSPFSVSERVAPTPSLYSTAAAPCPGCETRTAHCPSAQGLKRQAQG